MNNNGLLTFAKPPSDCIPFLNSGRDLIAPLWTHFDNRQGGTISCREDTSSDVLAQVNAAIKQNSPNTNFTASSAFVATWDNVPYYDGRGVRSDRYLSSELLLSCEVWKDFNAMCWYFEGGYFPSGFSLQCSALFHPAELWKHLKVGTNLAGEWKPLLIHLFGMREMPRNCLLPQLMTSILTKDSYIKKKLGI